LKVGKRKEKSDRRGREGVWKKGGTQAKLNPMIQASRFSDVMLMGSAKRKKEEE